MGDFFATGREAALLQHLVVLRKGTMALEDRLFIQGLMVMLSEGYCSLLLGTGVFEAAVILLRRAAVYNNVAALAGH